MPSLDDLYLDTVTLFNRYEAGDKLYWYPTVLRKVHFIPSRSIIISNYGERSSDNAMLNIRFQKAGDSIVIAGKRYYQPKQYAALSSVANAITFRSGEKFDFFIEGTYSESVVDDDSYTAGFYDYMNKTIDEVYAVTSVSKYSIIPHFTLTGR